MTADDTGDEASAYVTILGPDGRPFFIGEGEPDPASPQETEAAADEAAGTYEDDGETFTASGEDFIPEG